MTERREGPAATAELGLFNAVAARHLPRDRHGRFVAVARSPERCLILKRTQSMRAALGLPPAPALEIALARSQRNEGTKP